MQWYMLQIAFVQINEHWDVILDVDECDSELQGGAVLHNCSPVAACNNTMGSFVCTCNQGYQGTGVVCEGTEILTSKLMCIDQYFVCRL